MASLGSASHTIVDVNDNYLAVLTNDSHTLPANSSGTVTNYAGAVTKINIYRGADQELDTSWTYTLTKSSADAGFTATINTNGLLTVSAFPASLDSGYVDITATQNGISLVKRFTISKSKQGSGGANGVAYWQVASSDVIKRGTNNLYTPATITVKNMTANGATVSAYSGRFKIYEATDATGTTFETAVYTSSVNESERIYTPPSYATKAITAIKIETYLADGVTLVDATTIPVLLDGEKGLPGDKGEPGKDGANALSVMLMNENQSIAVTSGRLATVAQTISIPFAAYLGSTRTPATITAGNLPSGITVTSNTASTATADGNITLTVAASANLGGVTTAFDAGRIEFTVVANSVSIVKVFNWTKTVAGAAGSTARTYFVEPNVSVLVKNTDGSYTPSSVVFSAFYKDGTSATKVAYSAFWRTETTTDGTTWTTLATQATASTTFTTATIPANIKGIRVTIYSTSALTAAVAVDVQTVMVVAEGAKGTSGDTMYTWVKYADDVNGTGLSNSPTGKRYLGLAPNKTTQEESTNPLDYNWSPLYDNVEVGVRNLFTQSELTKQNTGTAFTVAGITYDTYAEGYAGYNGGILNPTTSYHSYIDNTTFGFPVVVYNESDGTRNWKGASKLLNNDVLIPGTHIVSFDLYATGAGTSIFGGFYYTKVGGTTAGFHAGQFTIIPSDTNMWVRGSAVVELGLDADFSKPISFYTYGYGFSTNSVLYHRKPQLERGNILTDYKLAPEDISVEAAEKANNALEAAELYANAQAELAVTTAEAYADGLITAEEEARMLEAAANLEAAKKYAEDTAVGAIDGLDLSGFATNEVVTDTENRLKKEIAATTGLNLLRNSIGYAKLDYWEHAIPENAVVTAIMNERLRVLGYGSGFYFPPTGTASKGIQQTVNVTIGQQYTLSWFLNKATDGAFEVSIYEDTNLIMTIPDVSEADGDFDNDYIAFTPTSNQITVRFTAAGGTECLLTGAMLGLGSMPTQWTLANGELYNAYVRVDDNGLVVIRVDENGEIEGFTNMTPEEFAGYYDENRDGNYERIFWFNRDETVTKKLRAIDEITMGTIKVIRVEGALNRGWAFVPIVPE